MSRVCVCTALSAVVELAGVLMEMLVRSLRRNALAVDARMASVHSIASGRRLGVKKICCFRKPDRP